MTARRGEGGHVPGDPAPTARAVAETSAEVRRCILEARAEAAARDRDAAHPEGERVVVFVAGGDRYAVEVASVALLLDVSSLEPLVGAPPWLLGVAVARSRIVPVLNVRRLLDLECGGLADVTCILVVEHEGDAFGLAAEDVLGERDFPRSELGPAPAGPFRWVAPDRTALLELASLPFGTGG